MRIVCSRPFFASGSRYLGCRRARTYPLLQYMRAPILSILGDRLKGKPRPCVIRLAFTLTTHVAAIGSTQSFVPIAALHTQPQLGARRRLRSGGHGVSMCAQTTPAGQPSSALPGRGGWLHAKRSAGRLLAPLANSSRTHWPRGASTRPHGDTSRRSTPWQRRMHVTAASVVRSASGSGLAVSVATGLPRSISPPLLLFILRYNGPGQRGRPCWQCGAPGVRQWRVQCAGTHAHSRQQHCTCGRLLLPGSAGCG